MSRYLDDKYIGQVCFSFRNFKRKSSSLYNFACPYCNEGSSRTKTRGFLFVKEGDWRFFCHNCSVSRQFKTFLKEQNPLLYKEYLMEVLAEKKDTKEVSFETLESIFKNDSRVEELDNLLVRCDNLSSKHTANQYLIKRHILKDYDRFYYSSNLSILKQVFPGYEDVKFFDEDRIVFPVRNKQSKLIGVVCRAISDKSKLRYVNLRRSDETLLFNIENINFSELKYVVEGPIDSLALPNCVAAIGSDLMKCVDVFDKNTVYIFDNQPKNREVVKKMEYLATKGVKMVVWPSSLEEKDINEMINEEIDPLEIINTHTYSGLTLSLKIKEWKKV